MSLHKKAVIDTLKKNELKQAMEVCLNNISTEYNVKFNYKFFGISNKHDFDEDNFKVCIYFDVPGAEAIWGTSLRIGDFLKIVKEMTVMEQEMKYEITLGEIHNIGRGKWDKQGKWEQAIIQYKVYLIFSRYKLLTQLNNSDEEIQL